MMTEDSISMLEKQVSLETKNAESLKESIEMADNLMARTVMEIVKMDSEKHATLFEGLAAALREKPQEIWTYRIEKYVDRMLLFKRLEEHIEREEEMMKWLQEEMGMTEDEGLKAILEYVLDDENKHHKMLSEVVEKLRTIGP